MGFPVTGEMVIPVAMNRLLDLLDVFFFLGQSPGESRRTGAVGISGDDSNDDGSELRRALEF